VGTRKATAAGKALAQEFGSALAAAGCTVVSGLALGIDAAAHSGALRNKGCTAAVLANGLDRVYPATHGKLANDIIENGGVLLSEQPPGSPPLAYRFLERNRIISGLAEAVLLIEMPERSGVVATARFATDQNRDIYVVPGPVNHPNYKGSNRLIRSGAMLVAEPPELLEDLGLEAGIMGLSSSESGGAETPEEERVVKVIRDSGKPLTIDEIVEAATLTSSTVNQALTMLTLRNAVQEEAGRYQIKS
jgi:DNA processing protein